MCTKQVIPFVILTIVFALTTSIPSYADTQVKEESKGVKRESFSSSGFYWILLINTESKEIIIDASGFYWAGSYIPITSSGPDELLIIQEVDTINSSLGIDSMYEHAFPHYQNFLLGCFENVE